MPTILQNSEKQIDSLPHFFVRSSHIFTGNLVYLCFNNGSNLVLGFFFLFAFYYGTGVRVNATNQAQKACAAYQQGEFIDGIRRPFLEFPARF